MKPSESVDSFVSDENSFIELDPLIISIDLFALVGVGEGSPFAGVYLEELLRLCPVAQQLAETEEQSQFWLNVEQSSRSLLVQIRRITRLASKGRYRNPVFGQYQGHELLGAILQPVESAGQGIFDGLKVLLVEGLLFQTIVGSYRAVTANEIRMGAETTVSKRSGVFKQLPSVQSSYYREELSKTIHGLANKENLNETEKGYIRALARLLGLRLLNDQHRPGKTKVPRQAPMVGLRRGTNLLRKIPHPDDGLYFGMPPCVYELIEPVPLDGEMTDDPPQVNRIYQEVIDQTQLGFDLEPYQQRRQSAYWLEQSIWVSPYNTGLIIAPDQSRLCACIHDGLASGDEEMFFISGLVTATYLTGVRPGILVQIAGGFLDAEGFFIRKLLQPQSAFQPLQEDKEAWLSPISTLPLPLPAELRPWLCKFVSAGGGVDLPDCFRSEKALTDAFQRFLKYARDDGRYELTESRVCNALRRELAKSELAAFAVYLLVGSESERPPVINHYASISSTQLTEVYCAAVDSLWR